MQNMTPLSPYLSLIKSTGKKSASWATLATGRWEEFTGSTLGHLGLGGHVHWSTTFEGMRGPAVAAWPFFLFFMYGSECAVPALPFTDILTWPTPPGDVYSASYVFSSGPIILVGKSPFSTILYQSLYWRADSRALSSTYLVRPTHYPLYYAVLVPHRTWHFLLSRGSSNS